MFSEREKFTGNKNRTGREIPDRNGPEREAAEEAGKAVRGGNIGTDSHLLIKYKFGLHPKIYKKTDYPL